jgi:hypothetical protein
LNLKVEGSSPSQPIIQKGNINMRISIDCNNDTNLRIIGYGKFWDKDLNLSNIEKKIFDIDIPLPKEIYEAYININSENKESSNVT